MQRDMEILLYGGAFKQLVKNRLKALQEKYDLKKTELLILLYLSKSESHTAKEIQQDMQMNKGHLSSLLDSLCKKEYVLHEVNLARTKPLGRWFYPMAKYVFCGVTLLVLILGAVKGGIG